jgi:hypothetical protein
MKGLYLLVMAISWALLGLMVWMYNTEKEHHEGEVQRYLRRIAHLEKEEYNLQGVLMARVRDCAAFEQGMDEMEEGYQQMILDHQEQLQLKIHQVNSRDADIIELNEAILELNEQAERLGGEIEELNKIPERQRERIRALENVINSRKNNG